MERSSEGHTVITVLRLSCSAAITKIDRVRHSLLLWVGCAIAVTAGTGCLPQSRPGPSVAVRMLDTVWYVSARVRDQGRVTRRLADSLEFGFVVSEVRADGDPLRSKLRIALRDSVQLTRLAFVASIRARARSVSAVDPVVVMYVHGFGTGQDEVWKHVTQSYARSQSRVPWVVFSWPSRGLGVAWPRAGEIFSRAYWDDLESAMLSRPAFVAGLHALVDAVGSPRVMLVAHSLGAYLTSEALTSDDSLRQRLTAEPLRAVAFFAPDVDAKLFQNVFVPALQSLTPRLVLYASDHDRILLASKRINNGERAGLISGSPRMPIIRERLESIDVTAGVVAAGFFKRVFGSHHGLSRSSAALFDLMQIVARKFPAECRATLGTAKRNVGGYWKLTSLAPLSPDAVAACTNPP